MPKVIKRTVARAKPEGQPRGAESGTMYLQEGLQWTPNKSEADSIPDNLVQDTLKALRMDKNYQFEDEEV
jgi:hypothetical protein